MSGICGVVDLSGAPIEVGVLEAMTASLKHAGPDRSGMRIGGHAAFGHTTLRTTDEPEGSDQPLTLDGNVWITADARIDARTELLASLEKDRRRLFGAVADAELILHAYVAWGERCVDHLLGDFAFAIWDAPRGRLFCGRDHFGVKPFFFTLQGSRLTFSNSLACLRAHAGVSTNLNDLAIADFLLFEMNQDPSTTAFTDIHRLPPSTALSFTEKGIRMRQYWSLPASSPIQYRDQGDYVGHFEQVLGDAVSDRLRTRRAVVLMSGGLDSSVIAATAQSVASRRGDSLDLSACTTVYDRLIPDQERRYSGMVAQALRIPIHYRTADDYALFERHEEIGAYLAEPSNDPYAAISVDEARAVSATARVALTGWDGDALLSESPRRYFRALLRDRKLVRLAVEAAGYSLSERKILPKGIWRGRKPSNADTAPPFPAWLNVDLVNRLGLRARWREWHTRTKLDHPVRPYAHHVLGHIMRRSNFFDGYHATLTGVPLEVRHPFLDLRVIAYCLALPPFPWCVRKEMLRRAMRGVLPEGVRSRPKTPLAGFPYLKHLARQESRWVDRFEACAQSAQYIDRAKVPSACDEPDSDAAWVNLRPLSLDRWLRTMTSDRP
jgi:asparagine synthase (glutamine-hydrolysing)